ncbi:hypothetical protein [Nocardia gipuzkoensis]
MKVYEKWAQSFGNAAIGRNAISKMTIRPDITVAELQNQLRGQRLRTRDVRTEQDGLGQFGGAS